jgi:diguanylate cyclase (GGDEF)-like protein
MIEDVAPLKLGFDGPIYTNPLRIAIGEGRTVVTGLDCKMQTQRGQWISVEESAAPLVTEAGEVLGGVLVLKDINHTLSKTPAALQHDPLTDLPNRLLLMEHLSSAVANTQTKDIKVGILLVDLVQFKLINEEYGFSFGDYVLKEVANLIKGLLTNNEVLSRHSADVFMILASEIKQVHQLSSLAITIKEEISRLAEVTNSSKLDHLSASIGVSIFPDDANDMQSLMLHADAALHRAKSDISLDGICFYSNDIEAQLATRRNCYILIKKAIADKSVFALYQPIVDPSTGALCAVEALMRIKDDQGNIVPPVDFIGTAEQTRMIIPLGQIMITLVLEQLKKWQANQLAIRVCINVSPIQFLDPHFIPFLLKSVKDYQIDPSLIELELTESLMLQDQEKLNHDLTLLRSDGFAVSIDDFGTGYSCLSYLKDLPVDTLKIDRSFVNQLSEQNPDEPLVNTIIQLAKEMKLKTVAEGVETTYQSQRLKQLGVTYLQGYHFSRPVAGDDIIPQYPL